MLIRVTRYYRALNRLRSIGLEKVFAHNLADAAGVNAVIVRKDFSLLGIHGQKRGGYDILPLVNKLGELLGKGEPQNVIIVGCGRIDRKGPDALLGIRARRDKDRRWLRY